MGQARPARQDKTFALVACGPAVFVVLVLVLVLFRCPAEAAEPFRKTRGTRQELEENNEGPGGMQGLHVGESSSMAGEQGGRGMKAASSNGGRRAACRQEATKP
jgi:hypothetical protein